MVVATERSANWHGFDATPEFRHTQKHTQQCDNFHGLRILLYLLLVVEDGTVPTNGPLVDWQPDRSSFPRHKCLWAYFHGLFSRRTHSISVWPLRQNGRTATPFASPAFRCNLIVVHSVVITDISNAAVPIFSAAYSFAEALAATTQNKVLPPGVEPVCCRVSCAARRNTLPLHEDQHARNELASR